MLTIRFIILLYGVIGQMDVQIIQRVFISMVVLGGRSEIALLKEV